MYDLFKEIKRILPVLIETATNLLKNKDFKENTAVEVREAVEDVIDYLTIGDNFTFLDIAPYKQDATYFDLCNLLEFQDWSGNSEVENLYNGKTHFNSIEQFNDILYYIATDSLLNRGLDYYNMRDEVVNKIVKNIYRKQEVTHDK